MRYNSKIAQVSIFVIVGVILLFLGIFYFAYQTDNLPIFSDQTNAFRVGEYVENCMVSVLDDGVSRLGASGGWLYPEYRGGIYINYESEPYIVQLARGYEDPSGTKLPYWFYFDPNAENFVMDIPEFDSNDETSIRMQLQRYMDENLDARCLNGFSAFEEAFDIEYRSSDISHELIFDQRRNSIRLSLDLPITINSINQESTEFIREFSVEEENLITVPYHIARDLTLSQAEFSFIEERMLNFIAPYQRSNKGSKEGTLPPFYSFETHYDMDPWFVEDVKELTQAIFTVHLQRIRFLEGAQTRNFDLPEGLEDSEFARGVQQVGTSYYLSEVGLTQSENPTIFNEFSNYDIRPVYDSFLHPMYFYLHGSLGNFIHLPKPEFNFGFIPFSFTSYKSRYEITTPILFEIENAQAQNTDFIFRFALEANIDNNDPLSEALEYRDEISDLIEQLNSVSIGPESGSLICDPVQFYSGLISLNITDPINKGDIPSEGESFGIGSDAFVEFDCKGITTCQVGMTEFDTQIDSSREVTSLAFRLPTNCEPGTLRVSKFGYETLIIDDLNPQFGVDINLGQRTMASSAPFNLSIKMLSLQDPVFSLGRELNEDHTGFLFFEHLTIEDEFQMVEITSENQYDLQIDLLPGNYSIQGFIINNEGTLIPEERKCVSGFLGIGGDCFTIPEIDLDVWLEGAIEIESFEVEMGNFEVHNELVIPFSAERLPTNFDELESAANVLGDITQSSRKPYFQ